MVFAANSEIVNPDTFNVTAPDAPPPDSPVPAVTPVMSPVTAEVTHVVPLPIIV